VRPAPLRRLLLPALALLAGACDNSTAPLDPSAPAEAEADTAPMTRIRQDFSGLLGDRAHWADGYLMADQPTAASYGPLGATSFNRSGGPMTITKPAATTGRYIVTFARLSSYLGPRSTVHVTAVGTQPGSETAYCKPVAATLAADKVEVRCFKAGTGAAVNTQFSVLVTRDYSDMAFAYANQPAIASYTATAGSWNPTGTTTVTRSGVGQYLVTFNGLAAELPYRVGGHVEVNAVGTGAAHCQVAAWGGTAGLAVRVGCFTAGGAPVDSKFTVLFLLPTDHLAYALADQLTLGRYTPNSSYSWNPVVATAVEVDNSATGMYSVSWRDVDPQIFGDGTAQVTAYGQKGEQCKAVSWNHSSVEIRCYTVKGVLTNSYFTVLLGS
jgi:hypothetical protein